MDCISSESSEKHDGEGVVAEESKGMPMIRDVTWVKLSNGSWWPALVVGSNSDGRDVSVRLYGSYEYMLVDPTKWYSEFQITLKENDGCYREILRKSMVQAMPSSEPDQARGKRSNSKGTSNERVRSTSRKQMSEVTPKTKMAKRKHNGVKGGSSTPNEDGRSPELSARRIKVMQTLGLAAPSGSPFHK